MKRSKHENGFAILPFTNRGGTRSFRVQGWLRGKRLRENFGSLPAAEARKLALEQERLGLEAAERLQATWLSPEQIKVSEWAFTQFPDPAEIRKAVEFWDRQGKAQHAATGHAKGVRLDAAVERFKAFLAQSVKLREATKRNLKYRAAMFASEVGDMELADITPETVENWLDGRNASPATRDNDRRALSRFFGWCIARPQRFLVANPCREIRVEQEERGTPEIYSFREVCRLLGAARRFREGRFLKFIVLQLFGGHRPTEALRFRDSLLVDGHIRIDGRRAKTGGARTIEADPVLLEWLKICPEGAPRDPQKSKLLWDELKAKARLGRWIFDGLRHTAVSHFFRRSGSFGLTAEWAGNSEAVIREHYHARTSAAESAEYWRLYPDRAQRQAAREAAGNVVAMPAQATGRAAKNR